ncbi:MAG: peptidoglycan DD-metalloendopeptidase family protein [bacterium]
MKKSILIFIFVIAVLAGGVYLFSKRVTPLAQENNNLAKIIEVKKPSDFVEAVPVTEKSTFSTLMSDAGVVPIDIDGIYNASKEVYDLAKVRLGKNIDLIRDSETKQLKGLIYAISVEEELHVNRVDGGWQAVREKIQYEIRQKTASGTVESSLYEAGLKSGIDERAIIGLADVFEWTIDFAQDVRAHDKFKFVYEELYRDGKYVMPGAVLSAEYTNAGTEFRGYLYANASGEEGYYDETGSSLKKMFLKAPLAFKYITSGFTKGMRYVSAFNTATKHRAIDYAASTGTPIRATADGTIVKAGWNGAYGNYTNIRHNATYSTHYGHQSKIIVKAGQRVKQGQIIGYVGSTGFSTGPHLHYEMVKNGALINPLLEKFPSTGPIDSSELENFKVKVVELDKLLGVEPILHAENN